MLRLVQIACLIPQPDPISMQSKRLVYPEAGLLCLR
jgi:hypothetical protein